MEPMPETLEALAELVSLDDPDVDELLAELGRSAHAIVPELVGLSLGLAHEGLTFTLLASNSGVAASTRPSTSTVVRAWRSPRDGWTRPRSTWPTRWTRSAGGSSPR